MRRILIALAMLMLALTPASAQDCTDCHVCENPKPADPCLRECSRDMHVPDWHDLSSMDSPDIVVINTLVEHYEAVTFDHAAHASMSGMGGHNCSICHHENPDGQIECCCDCHPSEGVEGDAEIIDLKSAYHRQCMFCHRDWSGEADCEICHLPLDDNGEPLGMRRQPPQSPHREARPVMNFLTEHEPAPYVTFHHETHAGAYGISCNDCHELDDCSSCHLGTHAEVLPELHDFSNRSTCNHCHSTNQCGACHSQEPDRIFRHSYTGFPLKSYHSGVSCRSCHGEQHAHGGLARDCQGCHTSGWGDTDSFDHASKTGVDLGEDHEGMECGDCHPDLGFQAAPVCSDCHDEEDWGPDLLN
jgi:hypothetical protein